LSIGVDLILVGEPLHETGGTVGVEPSSYVSLASLNEVVTRGHALGRGLGDAR
jgi:hypothetical protein